VTAKTKKRLLYVAIAGVVGFGVLQIVPAKKFGVHTEDIGSNPPARYKLDAPPEVEAVLRRACWDCHTNETKWPLYARIAPGSWLMARDVHNGRNHINFSEWAEHDEDERNTDHENCWEQVESGAMPKWFYVFPMHPSARLSAEDKALLKGYFLKHKAAGNAKAAADTKKEAADNKSTP
jgi:Haem-binding domain